MDRKEKRPPRVTSVVFNQHGTEILASYSSESLYLLDPKQSISQEQSQERLTALRNEKQTRRNRQEIKPTSESSETEKKKTSQFKRLRLRGDWSDTGPNSRPMHEQESESLSSTTTTASTNENTEEQQPTTRNRTMQNVFMQRMSDILTQLVARTEPSSEEQTATTTESTNEVDNNNANPTPTVVETNTITESTPEAITETAEPVVESPTSDETTASATTETNADDNESETSRDVRSYF